MFVAAPTPAAKSLLALAQSSPDAVTFDIYWATLPAELESDEHALWSYVQEDRLPAELRRRLMQNGLRCGIVGGAPPETIRDLLDPQRTDTVQSVTAASAPLTAATGVKRRTRQIKPGDSVELQAAEVLAEMPLLIGSADGLSGATYRNVQPIYRLRTSSTTDGRIEVQLTPELHYGTPKWRMAVDETGMFSQQSPTRDVKLFSELEIAAPLVAGEMLLVTSLPDSGGRLGHYFHQADADQPGRRKAILIRLAEPPKTKLFAED
jgi:hypothetical protein